MALLDAPQAKGAMKGGPTLFGVPMKQASLITVSTHSRKLLSCFGTNADVPLLQLTFQNSALILVRCAPSSSERDSDRPRSCASSSFG